MLNCYISVNIEQISHLLNEVSVNKDVVPQKNAKNIIDRICRQRKWFKQNVKKNNLNSKLESDLWNFWDIRVKS